MPNLPLKSALACAAAASALALGGCTVTASESSASPTATATAEPTETTPAPSPSGEPTVVTVHEMEFSIALDQEIAEPGLYTFQIHNEGIVGHNFSITGPGIDGVVSSNLQSGAMQSITVTLQPGEYEIWCSIGSHKQNGMDLFFTVP